jgi:PBP1b-binding outer membrane lipoprotein LpoB
MDMTRRVPAALLAAAALFATGCKSDEAAKKDVKNAAEDVKQAGEKAGKDIDKAADKVGKDAENAMPGDADDDGK